VSQDLPYRACLPDNSLRHPPPHLRGQYAEAAAVIDGSRDPIASRRFDELLREAQVAIEPVTEAQARIARLAYSDFGKGSGHPAKLDFGDCFAYALAQARREPLLFKGEDFSHTDVTHALP
jgi:ribonuclease VapC